MHICCSGEGGSAVDLRADMGDFGGGGPGAAWWQEWQPTAAEERQEQQRARKHKAWQAPADSDAQLLASFTTEVGCCCPAKNNGCRLQAAHGLELEDLQLKQLSARKRAGHSSEVATLAASRVAHRTSAQGRAR